MYMYIRNYTGMVRKGIPFLTGFCHKSALICIFSNMFKCQPEDNTLRVETRSLLSYYFKQAVYFEG